MRLRGPGASHGSHRGGFARDTLCPGPPRPRQQDYQRCDQSLGHCGRLAGSGSGSDDFRMTASCGAEQAFEICRRSSVSDRARPTCCTSAPLQPAEPDRTVANETTNETDEDHRPLLRWPRQLRLLSRTRPVPPRRDLSPSRFRNRSAPPTPGAEA